MTGPSAMGSENGTPSSMTSAPPLTKACISGTASAGSGSPAVMKGTSAFLPCCFSASKVAAMRDMSLKAERGKGGSELQQRVSSFRLHPSSLDLDARSLRHRVHVLVPAAGQVDEQDAVFAHARRDPGRVRERVRRFQRRDDALEPAQIVKSADGVVVGDRYVF